MPQQETKSSTKQLPPTGPILGPENILKTGFAQKGLLSGFSQKTDQHGTHDWLVAPCNVSDAPDDKHVLWVSMQVRGFVGREEGYVVSLFGCRKGRCMGPVAVMLSLDRRATLPCRLILLRQTNLWVTGEPQNCFASKIRYLSALNNHWKQPAHRSSDGLCPEHQPWVSHVGRRSIEYYQSSSWLSWYRAFLTSLTDWRWWFDAPLVRE